MAGALLYFDPPTHSRGKRFEPCAQLEALQCRTAFPQARHRCTLGGEMCNEYRFRQSLDRLAEEFSRLRLPLTWAGGAPNLEPRDSIRPTDPAPVIVGHEGGAELKQLRWGFPRPKGGPVINFRSENRRFPVGRCLIPADGFYEYTGDKSPKAKWLFTSPATELFCIAGLIREDRFTMLTMEPGPDVAAYHDRQIVILPREHWGAWLGPADAQPPFGLPAAGSLNVERLR